MAQPDTSSPEVTLAEFKGLRNVVPAERLAPSDLAEAVNVDVDDAGHVVRRDGYSQLLSAPGAHSFWSNGREGFFVAGDGFFRLDENYVATQLGSGLTVGAEMAYEEVSGAVYHTNGLQAAVFRDGRIHGWGVPNPGLPSVAIGAGQLPAGTYQYVLTLQRDDGFESGASLAGLIQLPAQSSIQFSNLPVSPNPDVVRVNIYMTPQNGDMLYLALTVPHGTATVTYSSDGLDLKRPLTTQFKSKPVPGTALAAYNGRMYIVRDAQVYYTQPLSYELMDPRDFLKFSGDVKVFAPVRDGIFVATAHETLFLRGRDASDFVVERVADYGAVRGTLAYGTENTERGVERVAFWESTEGKVLGVTGGTLYNMTHDRFTYSPGVKGASIVLEQSGIRRFISVMQA